MGLQWPSLTSRSSFSAFIGWLIPGRRLNREEMILVLDLGVFTGIKFWFQGKEWVCSPSLCFQSYPAPTVVGGPTGTANTIHGRARNRTHHIRGPAQSVTQMPLLPQTLLAETELSTPKGQQYSCNPARGPFLLGK